MAPLRSRCPKEGCREFKPCKTRADRWQSSNRSMPGDWKAKVKAIRSKAASEGWRCNHCGQPSREGQVDHIVNAAEGGSDDLTNLQWLCRSCHSIKTAAEALRG